MSSSKTVKVKKSQLFKQFKRVMDKPLSGLDPLELQVWENKNEVKEHYRSKGEFYPDGGPIACLGWKQLTEDTDETRRFIWHHTKQDAINDCLEHGPCDSEEELSDRNIKANFNATNVQRLEILWNNRKKEFVVGGRLPEEEETRIEIQWEDDTTAVEWAESRFEFYREMRAE